MKQNVGNLDRAFRLTAGIVIIALGVYFQSWWGLVGLVPLQCLVDAGRHFLAKQQRSTGVSERELVRIAVRTMGLDEGEFMRRVAGSYKLAIRFTDWIEPGHTWWHPFGPVGSRVAGWRAAGLRPAWDAMPS